jgi:hypothetical protein
VQGSCARNGSVTRIARAVRRNRPPASWEGANAPIRNTVDTGSNKRGREPWKWYAPHRAIVLLGVVLTLIALAGAFLGVANVSQAESLNAQLTRQYLVLLPPVREMRAAASEFQVLATGAFNSSAPTSDTNVAGAESAANTINKAYATLQHLLALPGNAELAPRLADRMSAYLAAQSSLGAFLAGGTHTPQTAHLAAVETSAEANLDATLASLQTTATNLVDTTSDQAHAAADTARVDLLWSIAIGVLIAGTVIAVLTRHALQVEREQASREAVQSDISRRIAFEASLQTALEMSRAEPSVFDVVSEALTQAAPGMRSELLLADSSKAHFRQVLVSSEQADHAGCGVMSPEDCPAASRARCLSQPPRPALLRALCPHEHRRQLHRCLPRDHRGRLASLEWGGEGRGGGRTKGVGALGDAARLRGLPDPGQQ